MMAAIAIDSRSDHPIRRRQNTELCRCQNRLNTQDLLVEALHLVRIHGKLSGPDQSRDRLGT
jgi:hypothetical protein